MNQIFIHDKAIIYPTEDRQIAIVYPPSSMSLEDSALMAVPYNKPFRYVSLEDIPTSRELREAWEATFTRNEGRGLGPERYFIRKALREIRSGIDVEKNQRIVQVLRQDILNLEGRELEEDFQ